MLYKIMNTSLLILSLSFMACDLLERQQDPKPSNILSEEAFANVLADFALAESASSVNVKNQPVPKMDSVYAFNPLLERNIRKDQYDSTLLYYSSHTDAYKRVYEKTLAILLEMQTKRNAMVKDSILK